jgi:hypothetical protein
LSQLSRDFHVRLDAIGIEGRFGGAAGLLVPRDFWWIMADIAPLQHILAQAPPF